MSRPSWLRVSLRNRRDLNGLFFVIPFIIGFVFLFMTPFAQSVIFSLSELEITREGYNLHYVGLHNYNRALFINADFVPIFVGQVQNMVISVPAILIFSFFAALLLNGNFVFPSTLMLRRTLMDEVGLFDPSFRRAGDNEYGLRLAAAREGILVDKPLTEYRQGASDQLTNPAHTHELTRSALRSLDRGRNLREPLSEYERSSYHAGRRRVLLRQAYEHLSNLDPAAARRTLSELEGREEQLGLKGTGLLAASLLPPAALQLLGSVKRKATRNLDA